MRVGQTGLFLAGLAFSAGILVAAEATSAVRYATEAAHAFEIGEFKHAAKAWEKAVKLDPANADYHAGLAEAYEREAEQSAFPLMLTRKARANFEYALRLDPNNAVALQGMIEFQQEPIGLCEGDLKEASKLIGRLEQVAPDAAQRQSALHDDAVAEASRPGQRFLCAPVQISRMLTDHLPLGPSVAKRKKPSEDIAVPESTETAEVRSQNSASLEMSE